MRTNVLEVENLIRNYRKSVIKESEEGCASFYQNLHEVDASLTGMGSFSDLPVKQEFVDQQWDLVERIHQLILENIGNNHLNC